MVSDIGPVERLTRAAKNYILRDRTRGFRNAAHRMMFYHCKGFTGETESQVGDVFPRALIADALCDARDRGVPDLSEVLDSECRYLISRRQQTGCGAWSYFPELPELPPDVDVLAQVMQVLIRCNKSAELREYVEHPLSVVLRDAVDTDGTFLTWIIPKDNRGALEERQARFVASAWGDTNDPEVNANFLYALSLSHPDRFGDLLKHGAARLTDRQEENGSWISTWYVGPFYGTYVCSRALAAIGSQPALLRAREFLLRAQRPDGGWGKGLVCNQLATGLALCGLSTIAHSIDSASDDREAMARGIEALENAHGLLGGWQPVPFIRMDVGRPHGKPGPELLYRSPTITAAYALKAAMAVGSSADAYAVSASAPSQH